MLHIAKGFQFLHTCNPPVVHRDLKPENILLKEIREADGTVSYICKIADLGISTLETSHMMTHDIGTGYVMAPEVASHELRSSNQELDRSQNALEVESDYSVKADIYSYGILCNQLFTKEPFKLPSEQQSLFKFQSVFRDAVLHQQLRPLQDPNCPASVNILIRECWNGNPKLRPTAGEIARRLEQILRDQDFSVQGGYHAPTATTSDSAETLDFKLSLSLHHIINPNDQLFKHKNSEPSLKGKKIPSEGVLFQNKPPSTSRTAGSPNFINYVQTNKEDNHL